MFMFSRKKEILTDRQVYLREIRRSKLSTKFWQIGLLFFIIIGWQLLVDFRIIDEFISSSPRQIVVSFVDLIKDGTLLYHLGVTMYETLLGFVFGTLGGVVIAMTLWYYEKVGNVLDPYLVVLNALPKVALGPIIIVWAGAGISSILIMTLAISLITTIMGAYAGFTQVDKDKIVLMKTFGATKKQILFKVVLPASYENILSVTKINVGLSWVGVIMGEFLVSKAGIGYLIMYGSQVFNLHLVMCGVVILCVAAGVMYALINMIEKYASKKYR